MKLKIVLIAMLSLAGCAPAWAQGCTGQPGPGLVCANSNAGQSLPGWTTVTLLFDRSFGATQGTILNRGASNWLETATPSLGLNGGTGGSITLRGSTSGSSVIGVRAAAGTSVFNVPVGNGSSGFLLSTDGAGNTSWINPAAGGTVTSVGLSLPNIFSVSGSPVTISGTLTGSLATQSANSVWSGPTTGAAATPTFRSLVGADLPNPSATTLGGVESLVGVTSNWIRSISTSGVPVASQPAFTDISGTLAPAQCPNPSASTIGCVESFVAVAHQWINSISTSGVPSSAQPNFSDLAGSATLAQLPSISNSSVLGNNSGGTAIPSTLSASNVLDFIGTTQGDVLFRGASGWAVLAPGTSGQVLSTGGASANPSWTTVTGTGTVTSVATNNGLTGGPVTTSGTIGLAPITAGSVLANVTGSGTVPVASAPSSILDLIGSITGDILYRSSGGWTVLAPGTNGQVLTQGASTPAWGNAGSVSSVATGQGLSGGTITTSGTLTTAAGVNTNTLNTQTLPYSIATTDCGKTVNIAGGPGTLTLPSVSGFGSACVVQACNTAANSNTTHAVSLSGFPAPSLGRLYMQQCEEVSIVNGAWSVSKWPGRFRPNFTPILFVDTGGNDANDGLVSNAAANALATMPTCVKIFYTEYDLVTVQPTCSPTGGQTFAGSIVMQGLLQGSNVLFITGNGGVATLRPTVTTGNFVFELSDFATAIITTNVTIDCTGGVHPCFGSFMHQYSIADYNNGTTFNGANAADVAVWCDAQCRVNNSTGPITLSGTFGTGLAFNFAAMAQINSGITLANGMSVANLIRLHRNSAMLLQGTMTIGTSVSITSNVIDADTGSQMTLSSTFAASGSTTGRQWLVLNNAVLCNDSATAIPGTAGLNTLAGAANGIIAAATSGSFCAPAFP